MLGQIERGQTPATTTEVAAGGLFPVAKGPRSFARACTSGLIVRRRITGQLAGADSDRWGPGGPCEIDGSTELVDELLDGRGRCVEGGLLLGGQLDLEDPLHAAGAEDDRHTDEQIVRAELALE